MAVDSDSFHVSLKRCHEDWILSYRSNEEVIQVKSYGREGQEIYPQQHIMFAELFIYKWLC
jgi:hypothetical protein